MFLNLTHASAYRVYLHARGNFVPDNLGGKFGEKLLLLQRFLFPSDKSITR